LLDHTESKKEKTKKSKEKKISTEGQSGNASPKGEEERTVMQKTTEHHIGQASLQLWKKGRLKEGRNGGGRLVPDVSWNRGDISKKYFPVLRNKS